MTGYLPHPTHRTLENFMAFLRSLLAIVAMVWTGLAGAEDAERVNINTADAETIARVLNGVGLTKAQAIVSYRDTHGRFDSPADLMRVKGIGESTVKKNADKITVSETPTSPTPIEERAETPE